MKRLLVLWDPENPIAPVGSVVRALRSQAELTEITFREVSHRTMPNRTFGIASRIDRDRVDGLLWVEGGPLPKDLELVGCPKVCWLPGAHHEPSLMEDLGPLFDRTLVSPLKLASDEQYRWLPLGAWDEEPPRPPQGVSLLVDDPLPPSHAAAERVLEDETQGLEAPAWPITVAIGQGGQVHPMLFQALRSGAAVVADPESDLRNIARAGEHLDVYPSLSKLGPFVRDLARNERRLRQLATRGREIVEHLHTPALRASELVRSVWPNEEVLGSNKMKPQVSVLVTCHRYLKRLRFCLESLARQDLPAGTLEIVVADPESPDGLAKYLREFAERHPTLSITRLPMDRRYHRNRGIGINRGFDVSRGDVIISIDGDILFPQHLVSRLAENVRRAPGFVYGVRRSFLSREVTEKILSGELDPSSRFEELARSEGDGEDQPFVGVLGYCQAVLRKAFASARYPEELDMVNQSDIVFVERLGRHSRVLPRFLEEESVLHLWHPRNWKGTEDFL